MTPVAFCSTFLTDRGKGIAFVTHIQTCDCFLFSFYCLGSGKGKWISDLRFVLQETQPRCVGCQIWKGPCRHHLGWWRPRAGKWHGPNHKANERKCWDWMVGPLTPAPLGQAAPSLKEGARVHFGKVPGNPANGTCLAFLFSRQLAVKRVPRGAKIIPFQPSHKLCGISG